MSTQLIRPIFIAIKHGYNFSNLKSFIREAQISTRGVTLINSYCTYHQLQQLTKLLSTSGSRLIKGARGALCVSPPRATSFTPPPATMTMTMTTFGDLASTSLRRDRATVVRVYQLGDTALYVPRAAANVDISRRDETNDDYPAHSCSGR